MHSTSFSWYLNFTAVNKVAGDSVNVNTSNVSVAGSIPHKYHGIYKYLTGVIKVQGSKYGGGG